MSIEATAAASPALTRREAAAFLRISETTLKKLMSAGSVPFARIGGQVRFRREALERLLREGTH